MKFLSFAVLFSLCSAVSAQDGEAFAKIKEHRLSNIDQRISYLQEMKSCVSAATTKEGIHTCQQTHKAKVKALKSGNESFRQSMKSERQARKDAKKNQ